MEPIQPTRLRLEATTHCQLRCPTCPTASGAIRPVLGAGHLKLAQFRRLLEENPTLQQIELSNFGEMFLNPELLAMMEFAAQRGVSLTANNGVNFNHASDAVIEGLVKYRFLALTVSLDGASQETYAQYRVRGNFDRVISHIRRLNEYKAKYQSIYPRLRWQFVVFGHNEHELPQARALAEELGLEFAPKLSWDDDLAPLRDAARVKQETQFVSLTRREYEEKTGADYMNHVCYQLWNLPQVNWDGKMLGCAKNFWGEFGSNAFTDGLAASVNSEKMNYARAMLLGQKEARADIPCSTCAIYLKRRAKQQWLDLAEVQAVGARKLAWLSSQTRPPTQPSFHRVALRALRRWAGKVFLRLRGPSVP